MKKFMLLALAAMLTTATITPSFAQDKCNKECCKKGKEECKKKCEEKKGCCKKQQA